MSESGSEVGGSLLMREPAVVINKRIISPPGKTA